MKSSWYNILTALCLFPLLAVSVFGAPRGVTVLESSDRGVSFRATPPESQRAADGRAGALSNAVMVAVPVGATIAVQTVTPGPVVAGSVSSAQSGQPSQSVQVSEPIDVRGRHFVHVSIDFTATGGWYEWVDVSLSFLLSRRNQTTAVEPDDNFDHIFAATCVNWETAKDWPKLVASKTLAQAGESDLLPLADQWYQCSVTSTGLHQITGSQLQTAGVNLSGLSSDNIRLFNAGGLPNEYENWRDRPSFREVAIIVNDGGDGLFGPNDEIVFFGEATDRFVHRANLWPEYRKNPYTHENVYWLAVAGSFSGTASRMATVDGAPSGTPDQIITQVEQYQWLEQDNLISTDYNGHITDYYEWYWSSDNVQTYFMSTPGAIEGDSAYVLIDAHTSGSANTLGYVDLDVNDQSATNKFCSIDNCRFTTYALNGGPGEINEITLTLQDYNPVRGVPAYLNLMYFVYQAQLLPTNNRLDFGVGYSGIDAEFRIIDNFTVSPVVFDVSDPLAPRIVDGVVRGGGLVTFEASLPPDQPHRFYCQSLGNATTVSGVHAVDVTNLRADLSQADCIIVTHEGLADYLDEYIQYREGTGVSVKVVTVDQIYHNFSYGMFDPTAIRDYLKFAYENFEAPAPGAVLFVGDGNYDYVNNLGSNTPIYVPSYVRPGDRTSGDDNFVYFGTYGLLDSDTSYAGGDRGFDMMTARWPVRTRSEINAIVDKIQAYETETGESLGRWRSRITLVADDEHSRESDIETIHVIQTERLDSTHIPSRLMRDKIYLWDYPYVNDVKPEVNEAIVKAINDGTLLINYVGHGNPDVWAHEHVLERSSDLPKLVNSDKLPLVNAASCAIGFFDDPGREGLAEDLLAQPNSGAIGVISATRLVYSSANADLNQALFDQLLFTDSLSIAEALFSAKLLRQYPGPSPETNDRAYILIGDPFVTLALPHWSTEVTEAPDSLVALDRATVRGRVVDATGNTVLQDGTIDIEVFDSDRQTTYQLAGSGAPSVTYSIAGPAIFRGSATIQGGEFEYSFIPPLDIGYGGNSARISQYVMFTNSDGLGVVDSIPVSSHLVESADSVGPEIVTGINGLTSAPELQAKNTDILQIGLSDPSGINLSQSLAHGITLTVDGDAANALNLTELFAYDTDSYTTGSLSVALSDFERGEHQIKIKAWDNANNLSIHEFTLWIDANAEVAIRELLNYPNPMGERTTFYFTLPSGVQDFSLEIFTLSGRNIWSDSYRDLPADEYPNDLLSITWDGRDADGDRVATGVYIYKATARQSGGGQSDEQFGKIVLVN